MSNQTETGQNARTAAWEILMDQFPGFAFGLVVGLVIATTQIIYAIESADKTGFGICVSSR